MKRRDFLKAAGGLGLAGAAAPAAARPNLEPIPDGYAMLYDSTLCVGCKACMAACKRINGMPPEPMGEETQWDAPRDLSGRTRNVIKVWKRGAARNKDDEEDGYAFVKRHCLHCVDPSCVSVCPVSAMRKDPKTGVVTNDPDACIGCRYCVYACPFDVPKYEFHEPYGRIQKCEFCNQPGVARLDQGLLPGCVEVCPTGASLFGTREELLAEARRRLALKPGEPYRYPRERVGAGVGHVRPAPRYVQHIYGEKELGGTQVLYLTGVPHEYLGLPRLPERSYASISETVQHTLYKGFAAPVAAFAGLAWIVRRNVERRGEVGRDDGREEER
ncbi:hydrogenase 2 operon protein HybA [Inmirania thermothiophila]|uniref:[NiFe]-hydrogenase II apoprotein ferredoxin-type subunit n=1 Tax=Inmirania thermothiophila TaxID=1750597 RepID=A0A3N1Y174_9GAMM|nr:hydrogenase 2 operon protein HybA [Inmirania thermothiophila]ROR32540.1 [NiFe]-hydrogenase II apoprotein ferredoxin-type subunit [Inmirania thermothiophila]